MKLARQISLARGRERLAGTRQLGGEPAYAASIAGRIAQGELAIDVHTREGDDSSLLYAIKTMRDAGIWVVGLDERAEKTLWDLTMDDAPVALVLGAEGPGLSRLVRERCDELVSIPMRGRVASLNVGTAGTLACFEIARARRRP